MVDGIIKFWDVAKQHPWTAILMLIVLLFVWSASEILTKVIDDSWNDWRNKGPFESVSGLYVGKIEGNDFGLCLEEEGTHVIGSMSWKTDPHNYNWVDYEGTVDKKQIDLTYRRNARHPDPDYGKAVITAPDKEGFYGGFFKSDIKPNQEEWKLRKVADKCLLVGWSPGG